MTGQSLRMTQGLEVLTPVEGQAYPIPCDEWGVLKDRVARLSTEPWLFTTVGSLLLGVALSTLGSILLGAFGAEGQERQLVIAWAMFGVAFLVGCLSLLFARSERGVKRERANDIVTQMTLIEKRFDHRPPQETTQPLGRPRTP